MAEYPYRCPCGSKTIITRSMSEGPPKMVHCSICSHSMDRVYGGFHFHVTGKQENYAPQGGHKDAIGINIAERLGRTPQQQTQEYQKAFRYEQTTARRTARETSKERKNMQFRKVGSIPREAWIARTRQHGKEYWNSDDPQKLAKRDGFLF